MGESSMENRKDEIANEVIDIFKLAKNDEVAKLLLYYIEHNDCVRQSVKKLIKACNRQEFMYNSPVPAIAVFLPSIAQTIINLIIKDVYGQTPAMATGFINVGCAMAFAQMLQINKREIRNNKWAVIKSLENKKDKKLSDSANNLFYDRIEELLTNAEYRYVLLSYIDMVNKREKFERKLQNLEEIKSGVNKLHVDDFSYEK